MGPYLYFFARAVRIELTLTVLETAVLPLYDARVCNFTIIAKSARRQKVLLFALVVYVVLAAEAAVF